MSTDTTNKQSSQPGPHGATAHRFSRREVLTAAASMATFTIVPRHVLGGPGYMAPSEQPVLAGVGVGGVGFGQVQACEKAGFRVNVLCDVDDSYARKAYDRWPAARRYRDFREMLNQEGDKIDAVYCGTPDHTHTIITLAALRQKKHVCCVKPLTHTVQECRTVVKVAQQAGVATQVTASPNTGETGCRTCELIWAGAIGPVRQCHVWSDRPWWPQGMNRPAGQHVVPDTFDWEAWIGPAPMRPFVHRWPEGDAALQGIHSARGPQPDAVYHPWNFRGWWDFGTGALGDMGCHYFNTPLRTLKLGYPTRVHATSTKVFPESAPLASIVTYDYPAREEMPSVRVIWYDGGLQPPCPPELNGRLPEGGALYIGDEGVMLGHNILTPSRQSQAQSVPRTLERRPGTWGEWLEACRGGQPAGCNFAWSGPLTEFVLLGNLAVRTGKLLDFDAQAMRVTNNEDADALIRQPYQNGWTLEG